MAVPRGVGNNNPGNLRHGSPWNGLSADQPDPDFCKFKAPAWGFRAMALNLIAYQDKLGARTIVDIVTRWAPPSENDTGSYITSVAKDSGFGTNEPLNLHQYQDSYRICRAMTIHEQGAFEKYFSKAQLDDGLAKAGCEGAPKGVMGSVAKSAATVGAAAGTYAASNPDQISGVVNTLKPIVESLGIPSVHALFGVLAGACVLAVIGGEVVRILRRQ